MRDFQRILFSVIACVGLSTASCGGDAESSGADAVVDAAHGSDVSAAAEVDAAGGVDGSARGDAGDRDDGPSVDALPHAPPDTQPGDQGAAGSADGGSNAVRTWSDGVEAFFAAYCVECHTTSPKDFRVHADVAAASAAIRCGVAPTAQSGCGPWPPARQFPVGSGPKPSDEERQLIVDWIDAGAP